MAQEAFALSPISARAAQTGESDYEAIREAFMETARGRWFLGEYAKRNRQTDTLMVLNAVARIERMLEAAQQPPPGSQLHEVRAILSNAINEAAKATVDGLTIEERLESIRKGARILKAISWNWREIGADSRICDSIDSQVAAIQEGCSQLAAIDIPALLTGAFELIRTKIEPLAEDGGDALPTTADTEAAVAATRPRSAAAAGPVATQDDNRDRGTRAAPEAAAFSQGNRVTPVAGAMTPQRAETASFQDETIPALLPIAIGDHRCNDAADRVLVEPACSEPVTITEPVERDVNQTRRHGDPPRMQPEPAPSLRPQPYPSLGSTPFASEFPEQRRPPGADPALAIRRMSLTEKIEFFS